jgi:hypothetical protein
MGYRILTEPRAQTKLALGLDIGYSCWSVALAPHTTTKYNPCPRATPGCSKWCVFHQGRGAMNVVQRARIWRTELLYESTWTFMLMLDKELAAAVRHDERLGLRTAVRLNSFSDVVWEKRFPGMLENADKRIEFYDYTKIPGRKPPPNYHLTFSRSESNEAECAAEAEAGRNIAVVFRTAEQRDATKNMGFRFSRKEHPNKVIRLPIYNGDTNDCRFLDPEGIVVGLKAKGTAKRDDTGFVLDTASHHSIERNYKWTT